MRNAITRRFAPSNINRDLTFQNYRDFYRHVRLRQMGVTGPTGEILFPRLLAAFERIVQHHMVRGRDPVQPAEAFLWMVARNRHRPMFARYFTH